MKKEKKRDQISYRFRKVPSSRHIKQSLWQRKKQFDIWTGCGNKDGARCRPYWEGFLEPSITVSVPLWWFSWLAGSTFSDIQSRLNAAFAVQVSQPGCGRGFFTIAIWSVWGHSWKHTLWYTGTTWAMLSLKRMWKLIDGKSNELPKTKYAIKIRKFWPPLCWGWKTGPHTS